MTEKVKVTQEQFDWLEKYKTEQQVDYAIDINIHAKRPDSPIADWKLSKLARALYIGYEVEPQFEVGDVVRYRRTDSITRVGEINQINYELGWVGFGNSTVVHKIGDIQRMATPEEFKQEKERQKFASIGRKLSGFKEGDIGILRNGVKTSDSLLLEKHRDDVIGFYPIESFVNFGGDEE